MTTLDLVCFYECLPWCGVMMKEEIVSQMQGSDPALFRSFSSFAVWTLKDYTFLFPIALSVSFSHIKD